MDIITGWTYKFRLTAPFSKFDGIYTVVRIMTFAEMVSDNVNLVETLYIPAGKTQADYELDVDTYRADKILKLVDPTDKSITRYIPAGLVAFVPDPNVKRYLMLALALNVGIFETSSELTTARNLIQEQLSKVVGVDELPKIIAIREKWLTADEYATVQQERNTTARETVNYFSENLRLQSEVDRQRALINKYEQLIVQLSQQPTG